jgi:hypothetical protein
VWIKWKEGRGQGGKQGRREGGKGGAIVCAGIGVDVGGYLAVGSLVCLTVSLG